MAPVVTIGGVVLHVAEALLCVGQKLRYIIYTDDNNTSLQKDFL